MSSIEDQAAEGMEVARRAILALSPHAMHEINAANESERGSHHG